MSLELDFANPFPDLSEITPEHPGEPDRFTVQSKDQAEWCLRQISRLKAQQNETAELARAEIEKINAWKEKETAKITGSIAFLESLLKDYHRRVFEKDPKAKTIKLPSGSLEARKMPPDIKRDKNILLPWVEKNRPNFVVVEKNVDWAGLKKELRFDSGVAFDPLTGEVVPGVEVVDRGIDFRVRVEK